MLTISFTLERQEIALLDPGATAALQFATKSLLHHFGAPQELELQSARSTFLSHAAFLALYAGNSLYKVRTAFVSPASTSIVNYADYMTALGESQLCADDFLSMGRAFLNKGNEWEPHPPQLDPNVIIAQLGRSLLGVANG